MKEMKEHKSIESLMKIFPLLGTGQRRELRTCLRYNGNLKASKDEQLYDLLSSYMSGRAKRAETLTGLALAKGVVSVRDVGKVANSVFQKVLGVLRGSGQSGALQRTLFELISDIRLLLRNGFLDEVVERIARAKDLARKVDRAEMMLELLQIERLFLMANDKEGFNESERHLYEEMEHYRSAYFSLLHLQNLNADLYKVLQSPGKDVAKMLKSIGAALEAMKEEEMQSFRCRRILNYLRFFYHMMLGVNMKVPMSEEERGLHLNKREEYSRRLVLLYEEPDFEHFQWEEATLYIGDVSQYVRKCIIDFNLESVGQFLPKIAHLECSDVEYVKNYALLRLLAYSRMCQYEESKVFIERARLTEKFLSVQSLLAKSSTDALCLNFMDVDFAHEQWDNVCLWTKRVLGKTGKSVRPDVRLYVGLINNIARWELGEFDKHRNPEAAINKLRRDDDANYKQVPAYRMMIRFQMDLVRDGRVMPLRKFKDWREQIWNEINGRAQLEHFFLILMWVDQKLSNGGSLLDITRRQAEKLRIQYGLIDFGPDENWRMEI